MSWLKKGDTVGLIAPSSGANEDNQDMLVKFFNQLGLNLVVAKNLRESFRYMAGSDDKRADAFNKMVANPQIKALFCLRGGAGSTRILDKIDFVTLRKNPKPIIGLSDSTALQNAAAVVAGTPSLSGFLPLYDIKDGKLNSFMTKELNAALFGDKHIIKSGVSLQDGACEGYIAGGCLSVFVLLCGTKYFPDLSGKILLLEDVGEKTYKIDLMLNQLKQQPGFAKIKGVIFGAFTDSIIKDKDDGSIDDCIKDFIKDLSVPVITEFAYGHIPNRYILPIGTKVKITADKENCSVEWQLN